MCCTAAEQGGRDGLQGNSLQVVSIWGRRSSWTFSAHTVNVGTRAPGRLCRSSEPHLGRLGHSHRTEALVLTWLCPRQTTRPFAFLAPYTASSLKYDFIKTLSTCESFVINVPMSIFPLSIILARVLVTHGALPWCLDGGCTGVLVS